MDAAVSGALSGAVGTAEGTGGPTATEQPQEPPQRATGLGKPFPTPPCDVGLAPPSKLRGSRVAPASTRPPARRALCLPWRCDPGRTAQQALRQSGWWGVLAAGSGRLEWLWLAEVVGVSGWRESHGWESSLCVSGRCESGGVSWWVRVWWCVLMVRAGGEHGEPTLPGHGHGPIPRPKHVHAPP